MRAGLYARECTIATIRAQEKRRDGITGEGGGDQFYSFCHPFLATDYIAPEIPIIILTGVLLCPHCQGGTLHTSFPPSNPHPCPQALCGHREEIQKKTGSPVGSLQMIHPGRHVPKNRILMLYPANSIQKTCCWAL